MSGCHEAGGMVVPEEADSNEATQTRRWDAIWKVTYRNNTIPSIPRTFFPAHHFTGH